MYSHLEEGSAQPGAGNGVAPSDPSLATSADPVTDRPVDPAPEATSTDVAIHQAAHRPSSLEMLRTEIARAMQVAADHERARIDDSVGADESAQVEKIFARAAAEAAELSKHADEDVRLIDGWFEDEVRRVRAEADRRIDERRTRLEQSLGHHGSLIDAEVESVHVAVQAYRSSLGAFFDRLAEERDPSAIARLAGDLPDPPDLDAVRAEARSTAMQAIERDEASEPTEPPAGRGPDGDGRSGSDRELVPVMDPAADAQRDAAPVLVAADGSPVAEPEPAAVVIEGGAASEQVPVAAGASASEGGIAARLIRTLTSWSSPAEGTHHP